MEKIRGLNSYLEKICQRLKDGDLSCKQKPIVPNPYIDFKVFAIYLKDLNKSDRTIKEYLYKIKDFYADVNPKTLQNFRKYIIFRHEIREKIIDGKIIREEIILVSDSAQRRKKYMIYNCLKLYILAIEKREWDRYLPLKREIQNPIHTHKKIHINPEDIIQLLKKSPEDYKMLFIFLINSGMRISETLFMIKDWIDFDVNPVEIKVPIDKSKGRKESIVYLKKDIGDILEKYCKKLKDHEYIFIFLPELFKSINIEHGA